MVEVNEVMSGGDVCVRWSGWVEGWMDERRVHERHAALAIGLRLRQSSCCLWCKCCYGW